MPVLPRGNGADKKHKDKSLKVKFRSKLHGVFGRHEGELGEASPAQSSDQAVRDVALDATDSNENPKHSGSSPQEQIEEPSQALRDVSSQDDVRHDNRADPEAPEVPKTEDASLAPSVIWSRAYENFKKANRAVVDEYELLLTERQNLKDAGTKSINEIAQKDFDRRKQQMDSIMEAGQAYYEDRKTKFKFFGAGKEHVLEDDVAAAVNVVLWAKDWIGEAVKASPEASLAWAGVSIVLPLLTNPSQARAKHSEGFEYVLSRMQWYVGCERLLLRAFEDPRTETLRSKFELLIQHLYEEVLSFQIQSVVRFYKSRTRQLARDVFSLDDWVKMAQTVKDKETVVKETAEQIQKILQLDEIMEINKSTQKTAELTEQMVKAKMGDEESQCLQVFRLVDIGERANKGEGPIGYEAFKDLNGPRAEGTCHWFLGQDQYKDWRNGSSGILLVTADPGCGKSVLAKHLVDNVLSEQDSIVCYFFFKDNVQSRLNQTLCALLHQLFLQRPDLIHHAMALYHANKDKLSQIVEDLWRIILSVVNDTSCGPIIFVLDALDECEDFSREKLAANLKRHFIRDTEPQGKLRILMTGRPYTSVTSCFAGLENFFPNMRISGESRSDVLVSEIEAVIRHQVGQLESDKGLSHGALKYLEERLLEIEHRTYIWLRLVFDYLRKPDVKLTDKTFRKNIVDSVPKNFDEAYENILRKSNNRTEATKVFKIVLVAQRALTVQEMQIACEIVPSMKSVSDFDLDDTFLFEKRMREWCGLFITISNDKIFFLHQTAREFLVQRAHDDSRRTDDVGSREANFAHSISQDDAHLTMAQLCISYIKLDGWSSNSSVRDIFGVSHCSLAPFLEYASNAWHHHVQSTTQSLREKFEDEITSLCESGNMYPWFVVFWARYIFDYDNDWQLDGLELLAFLGFGNLVMRALVHPDTPKTKGWSPSDRPSHALYWAARGGRVDVVKRLLESGLVTEHDFDPEPNSENETPLWWAVKTKNLEIVELLLATGRVDINVQPTLVTDIGRKIVEETPLALACSGGNLAVVKALLYKGNADLDGGYGYERLLESLLLSRELITAELEHARQLREGCLN